MSIIETINNELEINKKMMVYYKYDIFNKTILMKYVYINEEEKSEHIEKIEKENWILINKNNTEEIYKELNYPVAEFITMLE